MMVGETRYCENADCRVILFSVEPSPVTNQPTENCPSCGLFGRKKDEKDEKDEKDDD